MTVERNTLYPGRISEQRLIIEDAVVPVISKKEFCHHADHAGANNNDEPLFRFERNVGMIEVTKLYIFGTVRRLGRQAASMFVWCCVFAAGHVVSFNCKTVSRCERRVLDSCASMHEGIASSTYTFKSCLARLTALDIGPKVLTVGPSRPYLPPKSLISNAW